MDHCVSAFLKSKKEESYKIYMADIGYCLTNSFAKVFGANDLPIQKRYCELYEVKKAEEKPQETADEIIERMREKARKL